MCVPTRRKSGEGRADWEIAGAGTRSEVWDLTVTYQSGHRGSEHSMQGR